MLFIGGVVSIFYRVELFCVPLILYFLLFFVASVAVDLLIGLSLSIRDKKGERDLDEMWESYLFSLGGDTLIVYDSGKYKYVLMYLTKGES